MVSFRHYLIVSLLVTISAVSYACWTRRQFYNATIYMTTHKLNIVVLGNLAFLLLVLLGKGLKRIFLGTLTRDEIEDLVQNSKYAITETMLALTIFREELNLKLLMLFTGLLFMKIFHWLAAMRVESIARSQGISTWQHIRLLALLGFLAVVDWSFVIVIGVALMKSRTASVLLLFGFEYMILGVVLASTFFKYILLVLDARWESRGQHWPSKNSWMFYLEFTADLVRLFLYLIFFLIICNYYGLPLHLIRELGITFYNLRERIIKFIHFRKLTRNMNERFPDSTAEELANGDKTCIVCREDMEVGHTKKLPCNHHFHQHCLVTWLERSQSCPTCRAEIPVNGPPPAPAPNNPNAAVGVAAAAGAANAPAAQPAVAPAVQPPTAASLGAQPGLPPLPAGLPPLPPHLQVHLDALRLAAAQAHQDLAAAQAQSSTVQPSPATAAATVAGANVVISPPVASPVGLFGGSPAAAHPAMQFPMFGLPPPTTTSAFPPHAPFQPGFMPPQFMFPPPPPPPPAHLFGPFGMPPPMMSPPPFAPPSIAAFPSDALYGAYLQHHTMLLNHHRDFLESSLAQVKILQAQQAEAQTKFETAKREAVVEASESKEDGGTSPAAQTLTQRRVGTSPNA